MEDLQKELAKLWEENKNLLKDLPLSKQWANRAISRASNGFYFLKRCLECIHMSGTDPVYSRSIYTLLSINCELLLTAYLLALLKDDCPQKTATELMELIKGKNNHDLRELSEKIGKKNLKKLGIEDVKLETKKDLKRYVLTLKDGEKIIAEDLVTVRYDFKYDSLRDIDSDESQLMRKNVNNLIGMTEKIMRSLQNNTRSDP